MAELLEYKCPCCGGAIAFDSGLQKLKCPYCDTEFDPQTLAFYDEVLHRPAEDELHWNTDPSADWHPGEADELYSFVCNSCGGEIVADANTAATSCPFCGNPVVMTGRLSGVLRPDVIIPFKLDKEAAKAGLRKHLEGKKLLPKVFKDENHIDEIKGVYVPYWLFDATIDADFSYRTTRVNTWSDPRYIYTQTNFYSVQRSGNLSFSKVPADGSSKMPDDLMESLEPYDFSEAVDFQTAYLAGYLADKYDVTKEDCLPRVSNRVHSSTGDAFASTVNGYYATVTPESGSVRLQQSKASYALYPVWLLNTTWEGKQYTFAMNGQTGKFVGDLPVDKKACLKYWLIDALISGAAAFGLLALLLCR